jgi:DNA-binding PadR family transcriptional regulator
MKRCFGTMIGRIMSRTAGKSNRKIKKSYTLSPETVAFLEKMRKKFQAESVSAVLEQILEGVRREQERQSVERAITDYYSSLSDSELEENAQWGEFALTQFPKDEEAL